MERYREHLLRSWRNEDRGRVQRWGILTWWNRKGSQRYPDATDLLLTADCGGSNNYRFRLWKSCLQDLADATGLNIKVMHLSPGTSKWNKIEHRMFSHISINWRGRPLTTYQVVVNCIANTTTAAGLRIQAELDDTLYERGIKVSDQRMAQLNLHRNDFHGEWNYTMRPLS